MDAIKPLSLGILAGSSDNKTTVGNAEYVYCQNSLSKSNIDGTIFVAITDASGDLKSTFGLGTNGNMIIRKEPTDHVYSCSSRNGGGGGGNESPCVFTKVEPINDYVRN